MRRTHMCGMKMLWMILAMASIANSSSRWEKWWKIKITYLKCVCIFDACICIVHTRNIFNFYFLAFVLNYIGKCAKKPFYLIWYCHLIRKNTYLGNWQLYPNTIFDKNWKIYWSPAQKLSSNLSIAEAKKPDIYVVGISW